MPFFQGTTSYGSTGIKTITCTDNVTGVPFQPTWYSISIGAPASGVARTYMQSSEGEHAYFGATVCKSNTGNSTFQSIYRNTGEVVELYTLSGGVFSLVQRAVHDSIISTGFKVNITNASATNSWIVRAGV